jgi:hypothetical protein
VLGVGLLGASITEGAAVHERTGRAFSGVLGADDDSFWVLLYSPLVIAGVWALWRGARDLRRPLRLLGVGALGLLVLAIMPDLVPPLVGWEAGARDSTWRTLIEENLELLGMQAAVVALVIAAVERLQAVGALTWPPPAPSR